MILTPDELKNVYMVLFIIVGNIFHITPKDVYKFVCQLFIILGDPKMYMYMIVSKFSDLINWKFVYSKSDKMCK